MQRVLWLLLIAGCTHAAPAPDVSPARSNKELIPGEMLVIANDQAALETSVLTAAVGRDDFSVLAIDCMSARICRVVVERKQVPADEAWTRELIEALARSLPAGIESVEPNGIAHAQEHRGSQR